MVRRVAYCRVRTCAGNPTDLKTVALDHSAKYALS